MNEYRYLLNELIKTYHVFASFDTVKAKELLTQINELRLAIAVQAEQRQIFWEQLNIDANASGYTANYFFTSDDIQSLVKRCIAWLDQDVKMSLVQLGKRENLFTRQQVMWQQIASCVQTVARGQNLTLDLPQEVYLDKNESLAFGVTNQQNAGFIFPQGCNLKDDYSPNVEALKKEIWSVDEYGKPILPQTVLVPIQFQFTAATLNNKAVSVDGNPNIYTTKDNRSAILEEISTTSINSRITLIDNGRNQLLCDTVESLGIAGFFTNQYTVFYPTPYGHLLRSKDRLELKAVNGSSITGTNDTANVIQTLTFRGHTI